MLTVLVLLSVLPWALPGRGTRARRVRARSARDARAVATRVPPGVDVAVLLDLADAALGAGASVPGTLQALGRAVDPMSTAPAGAVGPALRQAGSALLLGAPWAEAWATAPPGLRPLADALAPAWQDGAAPGPLLRRAAAAVRADRQQHAQEAAARLGVRLVLPLGLCFLPAFVLLGIVPVVLAAGGGLL
ncbi:type II secretion system F family protein [Georgenia yuyongxinii]